MYIVLIFNGSQAASFMFDILDPEPYSLLSNTCDQFSTVIARYVELALISSDYFIFLHRDSNREHI